MGWCVFLPRFEGDLDNRDVINRKEKIYSTNEKRRKKFLKQSLFVLPIVCGSIWFETMSEECNQSMKHIWSVLLHNRWNVFVGAEVRNIIN